MFSQIKITLEEDVGMVDISTQFLSHKLIGEQFYVNI